MAPPFPWTSGRRQVSCRTALKFLALVALALCGPLIAAPATGPGRVTMTVVAEPTPVKGTDGRTHLAYELVVSGVPATGVTLDRVDVIGDASPQPLVTYSGRELDQHVMRPETDPRVRYGRTITGDSPAILYVWITLSTSRMPRKLEHIIRASDGTGQAVEVEAVRVTVRPTTPRVLGPPLRKGRWLAHNGFGDYQSSHWGSALASDGAVRIPQRYAIDFIGVDEQGKAIHADFRQSSNNDWVGFGAEVLAVLDGRVRAVRDGVADNPPFVALPSPASPSADDTYGNYVIVETSDGAFVHYAHLQRSTVRVKSGERIRRGQVIGRLGNSGNTNGAHLHFNVTNGLSPEAAQGLPYVFDRVEGFGRTTPEIAIGAVPSPEGSRTGKTSSPKSLPLGGTIVSFP